MKSPRPFRLVLVLALAGWGSCGAFAQTTETAPAPVTKSLIPRQPPSVSEYILGAGDQISIHIADLEEVSDRPMRIDPNGFIDLPLIGRIEAGGLTLDQLREQLRNKAAKYVAIPQVTVNLMENQSRSATVMGAVNNPGLEVLQGPRRLVEVISMAGGVRPEAGSGVVITRDSRWGELPLTGAKTDPSGTHSTATVSLEGLLAGKNAQDNILVDPGDVISIPKAEIVYVVGTVVKPGGFPLLNSKDSMSVLQTLGMAEGLGHNAAGGKARILRPPPGGEGKVKEIPVNIGNILNGKDPDVPLYANDVLYVPNSVAKSTTQRATDILLQVSTGLVIYRR